MSYRQLLGPLVAFLDQQEYGTKIRDQNGQLVDTGVQKLVDALRDFISTDAPIEVNGPLSFNNMGNGPAFLINNQGNSPVAIEFQDLEGHYSSFGSGLGNEGIVSNELIVLPWYSIDPLVAHCKYTNAGEQGGVTDARPPDPRIFTVDRRTPNANPGIGRVNVKDCDVGSGYGLEQSGSGFRWDALGGNDTFFVLPPPSGGAGGGGGGGGGGVSAKYGTITSIGNDTLTLAPLEGGSVVVAKPYYLRRSTFHGLTVSGITYTYSSSQTRTATDGTNSESQQVVPAYAVGDGILYVETPDGNGTSTTYMEVNADARAWAKISAGC